MLLEPREPIELRQNAARKWLDRYADRTRNNGGPDGKAERALAVIVLTEKTSDFLAEHDPQALKQAQLALDELSWEDFALLKSLGVEC